MGENNQSVLRSRQLCTILLADAQVRWLGLTVSRQAANHNFMSGFCDSDERSWRSLSWTPYHGSSNLSWLKEDFPMGFLLGDEQADGVDEQADPVAETDIILDPSFADFPRYSKSLYCNRLALSSSRQSWRLHTGKGNFFLVLHLTGPKRGVDTLAGVKINVIGLESESYPLVDSVVDLNDTFPVLKENEQSPLTDQRATNRQTKVMVFQFQVSSKQPAIVVSLESCGDSGWNDTTFGFVSGFEVILDTSTDSLWWLNSDFMTHQASSDSMEVDDHEVEMEKFRRASVRTAWELAGTSRQMTYQSKEGLVYIKGGKKTKKLQPNLKHLSFNSKTRMLSCFEQHVLEAVWEKQVVGRASVIEGDDASFKVSIGCTGSKSKETNQTMVVTVLSGDVERDDWLAAINAKHGRTSPGGSSSSSSFESDVSLESISLPKLKHSKSSNSFILKRHSSDEVFQTSDLEDMDLSDGRMISRCRSVDTVHESTHERISSQRTSVPQGKARSKTGGAIPPGRRNGRPHSPMKPTDRKTATSVGRKSPVKRPSQTSTEGRRSPPRSSQSSTKGPVTKKAPRSRTSNPSRRTNMSPTQKTPTSPTKRRFSK